jgi:HSP20 family protein
MSELKSNISKVLLILVAILVMVVGVQTWYLAGMHKQLSMLHDQKNNNSLKKSPSLTSQDKTPSKQSRQVQPLDDEWLNPLFDPDNWDPLKEMQQMQDHMNKLFGDAFGRFHQSKRFGDLSGSASFTPDIDVKDEKNRFVVHVDLPGTENSNIDVRLNGQQLTIAGTRKSKREDKNEGQHVLRRERRMGKFSRTLTLPSPVKQEDMKTHFKNGVLEVIIPKV